MGMKNKLMLGAASLAATFALTSPASAQNIGQVLNNVLGYGQYPYGNYGYGQQTYMTSQIAVDQCARAVEARLNNRAMNNQYNRWDPYRNPYSNWGVQGQARVLGIDNVRVRNSGRLRVTGVASSGRRYATGYGYGNYRYNSQYGSPDLRFTCNADRSGRVYDVDLNRTARYGRR